VKGITKLGTLMHHLVEVSPFVYRDELLIFESVRPRTPDNTHDGGHYLRLRRLADGTRDVRDAAEFAESPVLTEFGEGYTFGAPFVWDDEIYISATLGNKPETDGVVIFHTKDMKSWEKYDAVEPDNERLYNTSICRADDRFVMAIETNDRRWPSFTIRFAESTDLRTWTVLPVEKALRGEDRYCACPTIRYLDGWFYTVCLEMPRDGEWWFEEFGARSKDLRHWEPAPANPIIAPESDGSEDINTSDIDFCEWRGKTIIYYSWGSQKGEERLAHAVFDGTEAEFLRAWFPND